MADMTYRFTLKPLLLGSVSHGAQDFSEQPWLLAFELEADYGLTESVSAQPTHALSLLGWIKAWLCLLMGMGENDVPPAPKALDAPLNRRFARRRLSKAVSARKMDGLVYHIYRRYGLKRCQQWLYDRKLTGRVHWCFGCVVKRWRLAEGLARQNVMVQLWLNAAQYSPLIRCRVDYANVFVALKKKPKKTPDNPPYLSFAYNSPHG